MLLQFLSVPSFVFLCVGCRWAWCLVCAQCVRTCLCTPGLLGQFNFQVLLLSLVSSIALLTFASVIVKYLAFKVLPNK